MTVKWRIAFEGSGSFFKQFKLYLQSICCFELLSFDQIAESTEKVDIVIEITNLDLEAKKHNLHKIERYINSDTLILSSVLGITATETASWLTHADRLVGFAAFSPLEITNLIEICPALQTSNVYVTKASQFIKKINKEVEVVRDEVGLVFPRILSMIINEGAFTLMEDTASTSDIDSAMRNGTNYPYGPLEWADKVGLDDVFSVLTGLQRELGEERYRPAPIIRKMIYAGYIGERYGRGFYQYED